MDLDHPADATDWAASVHGLFQREAVSLVSFVPDVGHKRLIQLCQDDDGMRAVPLTTEEEGIGLAMGAWLGGERSVLLLQSSGVGNLVNALGAIKECRFPFLMLVTMRGEDGELNPWQEPMGRATPSVLAAMDVIEERVNAPDRVAPLVERGLHQAFDRSSAVAILISQSVVGIKSFQERVDP